MRLKYHIRRGLAGFVLAMITCSLAGCGDESTQTTIEKPQGIKGIVEFWEGDFMPPNQGTITPVVRELYIHELTYFNEVEEVPSNYVGVFFRMAPTKLIAIGKSDEDGLFQIETPPGTYSLIIREDSVFYAHVGGGLGEIFPVTVRACEFTEVPVTIKYKSAM